jgi:hypothetical protein
MITQQAILANIFLTIQNQLQTAVPELKFIDLDTGQLEYKDANDRPAVLFPCVLFDVVDADYSDDAQNIQESEALLEVRIAVDPFTGSTNYFTDTQKQNAINFFNIEHRVNLALHGWCDSQYFGPLTRRKARTERRKDNIRVRVLHYKFVFSDYTAMPVPAATITTGGLVIEPPTIPGGGGGLRASPGA